MTPSIRTPLPARARTLRRAICAIALLSASAGAQRPDMLDPEFSSAASAVLTFDHFAELCAKGKGLSSKDAAEVETWRSTNRVDLVRARIAELEADATQNARLNEARQGVLRKYGTLSLWSCRAALQATRRPEALFARNAPGMLAALDRSANAAAAPPPSAATAAGRTPGEPANAPPPDATRSSDPPRPAPRPAAPPLESIEAFGFDSRPSMGIGGFVSLAIYPIVLFRNGDALIDVTGLADPAGIEAHRRAHPDDWTRWRREGGKLQLAKKDGWEAPSFQNTYQRLPDDFRLDGYFRALSGVGNVAVGGTDVVTVWQDYRFWRDGRVVRGGGSGAQAATGDASVVTRSVAPSHRGRYRVEGLRLLINYDDGSAESYILIADPTDPTTGIWLDGEAFPRRRSP